MEPSKMSSPVLNKTITTTPDGQQQEPELQINVLELTLLLKVMGFRLNHLDYKDGFTEECRADTTVEIKCGRQHLIARLSSPAEKCACPERPEDHKESVFWEVLGTGPSLSPGGANKVEDASSNLLRELSKRGTANTKQLLNLIFEGFRKDHLPSTTNNSPVHRPGIPMNPIHTSTVLMKSPQRRLSVHYNDPFLQDDFHTPNMLTAPPNTPRVDLAFGLGGSSSKTIHNKDHLVYLEVLQAKEKLDKVLLSMKMNLAEDLSHLQGPAVDLSFQKIIEVAESPKKIFDISDINTNKYVRRSSMSSFPGLKSKAEVEVKKKQILVRNKSSIDTGAAAKSKLATVTSRYLLPKKTAAGVGAGDAAGKRPSPSTKKTAGSVGNVRGAAATAKRSPMNVGWR